MAAKPTYEALENRISELEEQNAELSRLLERRPDYGSRYRTFFETANDPYSSLKDINLSSATEPRLECSGAIMKMKS